jgi:hypothetical protein
MENKGAPALSINVPPPSVVLFVSWGLGMLLDLRLLGGVQGFVCSIIGAFDDAPSSGGKIRQVFLSFFLFHFFRLLPMFTSLSHGV